VSKDNIHQCALPVLRHLRASGRHETAREVSRIVALAADDKMATHFLTELIHRCHPRALGDIYTPGLDWKDWLALLDDLREACERELARRRNMPPRNGQS
jgi:hypothetical protein